MQVDIRTILEHLLAALAAGALIGLERSYHGRPAGFRTPHFSLYRFQRFDAGHAISGTVVS